MKGPPINKTTVNEVNKDNPVLKVIYLKTFKNPKVSIKLSKNSNEAHTSKLVDEYWNEIQHIIKRYEL